INPALQRATETALQDGLALYEKEQGRAQFQAAETNLGEAIRRIEGEQKPGGKPAWQQALEAARLPLYDVHWPAAVIIEKTTGRIVAMAGGFAYPLSQLNRTTQSQRQPGSALKPLTYLAALQRGLQPNTFVRDEAITLPPISGYFNARPQDYWTPKNYDGGASGIITLRRALEYSKNLATVNLLEGGVDPT